MHEAIRTRWCSARLARPVSLPLQDLEGFLTGKRESSENIQLGEAMIVGDEAAPAAKRPRHEGDAAQAAAPDTAEASALRAILVNERQLRDRNTMLSVPGRSFKRVLDVLNEVVKEELAARAVAKAEAEKAARREKEREAKSKAAAVSGPRPSGRYQRETATDAALKQIGAQSLGVQQVGFDSAPAPSAAGPSTFQALPPAPRQGEAAQQRQLAEPQAARAQPSSRDDSRGRAPVAVPRPLPAIGSSGNKPKRMGIPIIMVPPATTALLNMLNAKQFLEKSEFMTPAEAQAQGVEKHSVLGVKRSVGRKEPVRYEITDKEPKKEDWGRVAAVFCLGKPWQFKTWPFEGAKTGDLVATFQRVAGVYLHYADEPVDPAVKKWNVKLLGIARHNRDKDAAVAREFWAHLDAFLQARKSSLAY